MDNQYIARLSVDRHDLAAALKSIARVTKPRSLDEVVFSFEDGELRLDCVGVTARAAAVGEWSGRARVTWRLLRAAAVDLPEGDPVVVCVESGFLLVQRYRMTCVWHPEVTIAGQLPLILLALDPPLREVLALRYRFAEADLTQSGYLRALQKAEAEMEKRIREAWGQLAPSGVGLDEVRALVQVALRREAAEAGDTIR